jgi:cation diffusion facilitator family transporter
VATGSLGILAEALHSGLDLLAAIVTYFSVRVSDKPADRDHHFGHGKIENLSALFETVLLLITCVWIIYEGVQRLLSGRVHIEVTYWSYIVVIASILIDFTRSRALMKAAKKHNSQALEADALHFSTDIWSSAVVLLGLICAQFGIHSADSYAALIVAAIVIYVCYNLGKRAIAVLLDRAPEGLLESIYETAATMPEIFAVHDIASEITRMSSWTCIYVAS